MSAALRPVYSRLLRLAADLRDPSKRSAAIRRIRHRTSSLVRTRLGWSVGGSSVAVSAVTTDDPPRSKVATARISSVDARWAHAWVNLASRVRGGQTGADPASYDWRLAAAVASDADRHRGEAALAAALAEGQSLPTAVRRAVEALADAGEWATAWSLTEGIGALSDGKLASELGHLVLLHRQRQFERLWRRIESQPVAHLADHLPVEAVDAALAAGAADGRALAAQIVAEPAALPTVVLVDLAGRFLAVGDRDQAEAIATEIRARGDVHADERIESSWVEIQSYLHRPVRAARAGAMSMAVFDYQSPDQMLASGNLGDYVQTLGLVGNLARFSAVTFTGERELGVLATELQGRVRSDLRIPEVTGSVHLVPVDRDFSSGSDIPDPTWLIAFGWHMHPVYDIHFDFPLHPHLRPIFVSVHINRLGMLSEAGLDYLRRYGPVGCRDWATVYLLLSAGVDAFFTGCLTTTVDALFPDRSAAYEGDGSYGLIDITSPAAGDPEPPLLEFTHQDSAFRRMSFVDGVRAASDRLADYQCRLRAASTRRLHAFLPLAALGVPVTFVPWSSGDPRFLGLRSIQSGSPYLKRMQKGLRELIATTCTEILEGAPEDAVYTHWRTATADRVAKAKDRYLAHFEPVSTSIDIEASLDPAMRVMKTFGQSADSSSGDSINVVLCFDERIARHAPVTIQSILDHASLPVRFFLLTRGVDSRYQRWLAEGFRGSPITFVPCDNIAHGRIARLPERITVSTMDRLLLPHLLPTIDRAIYLDIDTLVLDDIGHLARLDLEGHPLAARDSNVPELLEWRAAVRRLPGPVANEVLIKTSRRNGFGHPALNAGVLVLDLARMRADDFTRTYLGWVEKYGFHDQDVMLAYAGSDRVHLPPRWNALPVLEDVPDPAIIHWAALPKPWDPQVTFRQRDWWSVAHRVAERCGDAPDPADSGSDVDGAPLQPLEIGPRIEVLAPEIEEAIRKVESEHLSYLGATALRTLAATVIDVELDRRPRRVHRGGRGARWFGDRDGNREAGWTSAARLRRVRHDPRSGRTRRR